MPKDSGKRAPFRNGKSDCMSGWNCTKLWFLLLFGRVRKLTIRWEFCQPYVLCQSLGWKSTLRLCGTWRTDVEHVWRQWVFADWANGSNHENAQITETLNKGALITADLGNNVDHKSLVDVPTHWHNTTIIQVNPLKIYFTIGWYHLSSSKLLKGNSVTCVSDATLLHRGHSADFSVFKGFCLFPCV